MANGEIGVMRDMVVAQIAAEALLPQNLSPGAVRDSLAAGNENSSVLPAATIAQQFGDTSSGAANFQVIAHQDLSLHSTAFQEPGSRSGFSATLLKIDDSYTLSFRSTEFARSIHDPGDIYADLQVGRLGWAFQQMWDMEQFWNELLLGEPLFEDSIATADASSIEDFRNYLHSGGALDVTGFSLGGNLAQAFTELHRDVVNQTYLFNAVGSGQSARPLSDIWAMYTDAMAEAAADTAQADLVQTSMLQAVSWARAWMTSTPPGAALPPSARFLDPQHIHAGQVLAASGLLEGAAAATLRGSPRNTQGGSADTLDIIASTALPDLQNGDAGFFDSVVADFGRRHGSEQSVWYERQPAVYWETILATGMDPKWGTGHSIVLLQDSLSVMALFEQLAPNLTVDALGSLFELGSYRHHDSLERAANSLAVLLGSAPMSLVDMQPADIEFDNMRYRNALHNHLNALRENGVYATITALDPQRRATIAPVDTATLVEGAQANFGSFLALYHLSPFEIHHENFDALYQSSGDRLSLYTRWQEDMALSDWERSGGRANFTEQFLSDRALMLTSHLNQSEQNIEYGSSSVPLKFGDQTQQVSFNGDALGLVQAAGPGGEPLLSYDPSLYDGIRSRILFGSKASDSTAVGTVLETSAQADYVYGMDGADTLHGLGGDDYIEGGAGDDLLDGGHGTDTLVGGKGDDIITGGASRDYLSGGAGADTYIWNQGDGNDIIADYDDGGDRILIDGVDLSDLNFRQVSLNLSIYRDDSVPGISLSYSHHALTVSVETGSDTAQILVTEFDPTSGSDFGITYANYVAPIPEATDVVVAALGASDEPGDNETDWEAWRRSAFSQRNIDWEQSTITMSVADTANAQGTTTHPLTAQVLFEGGPLADHLTGDSLNNSFRGLAGDDRIDGGAGDDLLEGWQGADVIHGGSGDDILFGDTRLDLLDFLDGLDAANTYRSYMLSNAGDGPVDINVLDGGVGADRVTGGEAGDLIAGGHGDDSLWGGAGADEIQGGDGADHVLGDSVMAYATTLSDTELIYSASTAYASGDLSGHNWNDRIEGGAGDDSLWGELGDDVIRGGDGDDFIVGDRNAALAQLSSSFLPYGNTQIDLDAAFHGDDDLAGGAGEDVITGGGGHDTLHGGTESDHLFGGEGNDNYVLRRGDGVDRVVDTHGVHTLVFQGMQPEALAIYFKGGEVSVGIASQDSADRLVLDRGEWGSVAIAINSAENIVDRARLDTYYLDDSGDVALQIFGSRTLDEATRDELFQVDDSDPDAPTLQMGPAITSAAIEGDYFGADQHLFRLSDLHAADVGIRLGNSVDIMQRISAADWPLFDWLEFEQVAARTSGIPYSQGGNGDDNIVGTAAADLIYGGGGNDQIAGMAGDDALYGGSGINILNGGRGDDLLVGGLNALYEFKPGDGTDVIDSSGIVRLNFQDVNRDAVELVHLQADGGDSRGEFEIRTGANTVVAGGSTTLGSLSWVGVDGFAVQVTQKSSSVDGTFHGTRLDDVFDTGSGDDTIYADPWGEDVYLFAEGYGSDTIIEQPASVHERLGQIRFASDVDFYSLGFRYEPLNGDVWIDYGDDEIFIDGALYYDWENPLAQFTLASESSPYQAPLIRPSAGYNGQALYGSFGTDHIVSGDASHVIRPGYGDDLIEAGGGPDYIYLADHYLYEARGQGIGHKYIVAGSGDDTIVAPVHQGLTFDYRLGDGFDLIDYDWSYDDVETTYAYNLALDYQARTARFTVHGEDVLRMGPGITLDDLGFTRIADDLLLNVSGDTGQIHFRNFFVAEAADATADQTALFTTESFVPGLLTHPAVLAQMPLLPLARIALANGDVHDVARLLQDRLVHGPAVVENYLDGTEFADTLTGSESGNDVILAFEGDDTISDSGGQNYIDAGAGDDHITVDGTNLVRAGAGDDTVRLMGGTNTIDAGSGSNFIQVAGGTNIVSNREGFDEIALTGGSTTVRMDGPSTGLTIAGAPDPAVTAIVELPDGVRLSELSVEAGTFLFDIPSIDIVISSTGQRVVTAILDLSATDVPSGSIIDELRFSNGSVVSGSQLFAMAHPGVVGQLVATPGDDLLGGTPGSDVMDGLAGDDTLMGYGGADLLTGGAGDDLLMGNDGDDSFSFVGFDTGYDILLGASGFDQLIGSAGNDRIGLLEFRPENSIERIDGKAGVWDLIAGNEQDNTLDFSATEVMNVLGIAGYKGNDTLTGSAADDVILGQLGDDHLTGGGGDDLLDGGEGDDTFYFQGHANGYDSITGAEGYDAILGSGGNDTLGLASFGRDSGVELIDGGGGQWDVIAGNDAANQLDFTLTQLVDILAINGGAGDDTLTGSAGNDVILGSAGDDVITGGSGNDLLQGGEGNDRFDYSGSLSGHDAVNGGAGFDAIAGSDANDTIGLTSLSPEDGIELIDTGSGFWDVVSGDGGANVLDFSATVLQNLLGILGNGGDDTITGSNGHDHILGQAGNDTLSGGEGNDVLVGGQGIDVLSGGTGDDLYRHQRGDQTSIVRNFDNDPNSSDGIDLGGIDYEELWFSRDADNLIIDVVGAPDRVAIEDWYLQPAAQLATFSADNAVLLRNDVATLVDAMAVFDVPQGVDYVVPEQTRSELEPVLAAVWQPL